MAAVFDGSMDLWVLEDYAGSDGSWRHHFRVKLPPSLLSARWAMNAGDLGQDMILLQDGNYVVVLYDLAEKKVLKQFEFVVIATTMTHVRLAMCSGIASSGMPSSIYRTPILHLVSSNFFFQDEAEPHFHFTLVSSNR